MQRDINVSSQAEVSWFSLSYNASVYPLYLLRAGGNDLSVVFIFYSVPNARIASAVLATAIPSVCLSVRPSHAGIVSKRRHVARCNLHRWIAKCV